MMVVRGENAYDKVAHITQIIDAQNRVREANIISLLLFRRNPTLFSKN